MRIRTVPVFFDFMCPWSLSARARERRLQKEEGVRFAYVPWELHPGCPPEGKPNLYGLDEEIRAYAKESGIRLRASERLWNTRRALRGLHYARAQGAEEAYVDACFAAVWEQGRNPHEEETLRQVARESGLDDEAFLQAAHDATWDAALAAADAWAEKLGVETTVTYVVHADEGAPRTFQGLVGYETWRRTLLDAAKVERLRPTQV